MKQEAGMHFFAESEIRNNLEGKLAQFFASEKVMEKITVPLRSGKETVWVIAKEPQPGLFAEMKFNGKSVYYGLDTEISSF